ncbi:MAG: serine/threonine protein kinase [Gemmataceae bacterium]|nr:serine/threonine protein kinase [Gemmataceae bacterium]
MATTDLGACEWFVWDLRRSNLIDRGQLDQVVSEFLRKQPRAEPPALAEYLVNHNILTQFQADRILQGKTQGLVLGPYTLMDSIGTGSMGTVYKAFSKTDNKWYAVKVLPRRSMWNVRLARRQVRSFEQFQHAAVVPFVDVGTSGGLHYLAWPLVEGESVEVVVQREGKLSPDQAALFASQVAQGLAACHHHGIFHGLLKPSNMMLGPDGQIHILDFGIGSLLAENEGESLVDTMSTANTMTSGLDCASPESIMEPTNRTAAGDQYSLGCCLYFFLTGRYPFPEGSAVEKMMAHQYKQPTSVRELVPDVPAELEEVVERLMQKTAETRFSNTDDVVEALRPLAASAAAPVAAKPAARGGAGTLRRPNADNGVPAGGGRGAPPETMKQGAKGGRGSAPDMAPKAPAGKGGRGSSPEIAPKGAKGSAPTLRPPAGNASAGGGNVTRKSLRESIASPAPPPKKELPPEEEEYEDPEDSAEEDEEEEEEEEEEGGDDEVDRGSAIIRTVIAVVVCGIAFYVAMCLFSGKPLWPPFFLSGGG